MVYCLNMDRENLSGVKQEERGLGEMSPLVFHKKICSEDSPIRMHYHSSYEINVCEGAKGIVNIEGDVHRLEETTLIFLPPGTLHSYRVGRSRGFIKVWHLGLNFIPELDGPYLDRHFGNKFQVWPFGKETSSVETLLDRVDSRKSFGRCADILELLQLFSAESPDRNVPVKNEFLHNVISWTEQFYADSISLEKAASAVNLSRFHFARKFKEQSGSTYMEYLNNLRLENSMVHLEKGLSVSESAELSGFADVSYYIRRFRLMYGKTPLEYQKGI